MLTDAQRKFIEEIDKLLEKCDKELARYRAIQEQIEKYYNRRQS